MKTETPDPLANRILASLSQTDFSHVSPLLKNVSHEQGFVLQEWDKVRTDSLTIRRSGALAVPAAI